MSSTLGKHLEEWLDAVGYSYEAGEPPETARSVAKLMDGDGGLLIAITTFRALDLLHQPRPFGSRLRRLVGKVGRDSLAYVDGAVCFRCREAYPCATVRMISALLRLPVIEK